MEQTRKAWLAIRQGLGDIARPRIQQQQNSLPHKKTVAPRNPKVA